MKKWLLKGGSGASGRVLPPVTGRSQVRVAVFSHCTGEGKACNWHPSPNPAQNGSSLHWVRPLIYVWVAILICNATPRWPHSLTNLILACTRKKATFHHYFSVIIVSVSMPGTIGYMAPGTPSHTSLVFYHAKLLIHVLLQLILLLVNIFFTRVRFQ